MLLPIGCEQLPLVIFYHWPEKGIVQSLCKPAEAEAVNPADEHCSSGRNWVSDVVLKDVAHVVVPTGEFELSVSSVFNVFNVHFSLLEIWQSLVVRVRLILVSTR